MPVRLNITVDEDVHQRLSRKCREGNPPVHHDAVRARLRPSRGALNDAYKPARERWRKAEACDWSVTDFEDWPA
jgi:hypothetical protein